MSSPAVVRFPVPRHIEKSITTVSPAVSTIPHSRRYEKLEFPINTIIRRIFAIHPDKIRGCLNSTSCRDRPRVCAYHCTVSLLRLRIIRTGNRKLRKLRHIDAIDPPFLPCGVIRENESSHATPLLDQLATDLPAQKSCRAGYEVNFIAFITMS